MKRIDKKKLKKDPSNREQQPLQGSCARVPRTLLIPQKQNKRDLSQPQPSRHDLKLTKICEVEDEDSKEQEADQEDA